MTMVAGRGKFSWCLRESTGASQTFPVHLLRLGAHVDNDVRMRDPDLFPTPYVPLCQPVLIYLPLNIFARLHCANTGWSMQVSIVRVCIFTIANGFGPAHWVLFESLKLNTHQNWSRERNSMIFCKMKKDLGQARRKEYAQKRVKKQTRKK